MKLPWIVAALAIVGFLPLGCSDDTADISTSGTVLAAPIRCTLPQVRKGNKCVTPVPTTKVCPDGSTIPVAQSCPIIPPPPPPTQTCWDGSVIPTTQTCPVKPPPPPPVQCPDGTTVPAGQTCPVVPPPPPPVGNWVPAQLFEGGYARALAACSPIFPGTSRALVMGEIVALEYGGAISGPWPIPFAGYTNGSQLDPYWGWFVRTPAKEALSVAVSCLEGVAPVAGFTPPPIPNLHGLKG